ncbi:hypothetical protein ACX80E_08210 [Arthrobacter sp. TMN-49]
MVPVTSNLDPVVLEWGQLFVGSGFELSPAGLPARRHYLWKVPPGLAFTTNRILAAHGHLLRSVSSRWLGPDAGQGRHLLGTPKVCMLGWDKKTPAVAP